MAAVVPIVSRTLVSSYKDYTIPGSQEIILRAAHADFNGAAVTGAFVPVVQLISPSGDVMWTAIADQQVQGGNSASVSWFPTG